MDRINLRVSVLLLSIAMILTYSNRIYANNEQETDHIRITGYVVDINGDPLPGTYIYEKGTNNGTLADDKGFYEITVFGKEAVLTYYFLGFAEKEIVVGNRGKIDIVLEEDVIMLNSLVVTALGIKREKAALTYAVKEVSGSELTDVKDANMINALSGKVAGVQINKASSGLGASSKVLIRGIRSVVGNNQPLYVIDGMPMLNESNEQASTAVGGTADAGNRDGGDGISNLNPEDVESISILKGAPAAALYGSQAANGVILITTKKGSTNITRINFSSSTTFENVMALPEFQNSYGISDQVNSWGEKRELTVYDNLKDFYNTGVTSINSLSISAGNNKYQTYFSYANTSASGIIPNTTMGKHNFNFRETASLLNDKLKLDANITLFNQNLDNRHPVGGFYMNSLVGLYRFPRGEDITPYKESFEIYDELRNLYVQNWHSDTQDFEQNPYWITNRITSQDRRYRGIASLSANLTVTDWLTIQARGSIDYADDYIRQQFYASTAPALAGNNGRYIEMYYKDRMIYGDILALFNKHFSERLSFQGAIGTSINDKNSNSLRYDSKTASLKYPNVFNIANILMNGSAYISQRIDARRQMQSVFATAQIGFDDALFLDLSARNDWASTLAFTPHEKSGFFYPSVGISWIVSRMLNLPEWVSFGKLRAVYSQVGNDIPLFITNPVAHISAGGEIEAIDAAPFEDLKPEMTRSVELGTEWQLFDSRLHANITWYKTNTLNQFFKLPAKSGDKYAYRYVNAGDIQNTGWEISLGGTPVDANMFLWKTEINYSRNRNKVIKMHEELPVFLYGPSGFSSSYAMKLREGGSFGDIYGKAFERDENDNIVYDNNGMPKVWGDGNNAYVGNCYPDFNMSWSNRFSYKNFSLYILIDSRFGGSILSQTLADMDQFGVTVATGTAREQGYVELEGTKIYDVETFYRNIVGGRAGVTEYYMYDATNIRLRELSLSYTLPKKWLAKSNIFNNVQLSFVGRNLFFIYKKAPFDPELILSTGNDNQGIEVYGLPTTRTIGFNIKCEF